MINAFRHQRFLHSRRLKAQTASKPCDQRLSASKIFALRLVRAARRQPVVINAFRHQRFLHGTTDWSGRELRLVINAFRHQRFLHSVIFPRMNRRACDQRLSASKIFALACALSVLRRQGAVINAFRHQRFLHRNGRKRES